MLNLRSPPPRLQPPVLAVRQWDVGGLEFGAGWWFGGCHDLHVLGKDSLERLISVDHGAEHQWLKETET